MGDEDDPIAALEARLEAVRQRARAGIPARLAGIEELLGRLLEGEPVHDELRRAAHQLRGIAEDPASRAHAEAVEQAAMERREDLADAVRALLRHPMGSPPKPPEPVVPHATSTATREGAPAVARLRILVVDDTESLRKMNRIALERMGGHHVDEASGLREALEAVERLAYDVVLLDAMMPDGSGMELSTELRRRHPRMRLVILSAASEAQLAPGGHDADAWWQKPLSPKLLVERIAELLET